MNNTAIKVSKSDKGIKTIVSACYPEWKGRKIRVATATTYQMANYWSEGSRCYVVAYDLATGRIAASLPDAGNPFRDQAHTQVSVPDGVLLVEHQIFCGKDAGVTIYANPANLPRFLQAGK